jgi:hypothetical protein
MRSCNHVNERLSLSEVKQIAVQPKEMEPQS